MLSLPVSAQSLQWDANGVDAGVTDGGGIWNTTGSNWWNGSSNTTWDNAASNIAVFGNGGDLGTLAADATVTVSGTVNAAGLRFNTIQVGTANRAYILEGGTVALMDGAFIRMEEGSSNSGGSSRLNFNNVFAGSNITFEKEGASSAFINIAGANTWTGTMTLATGGGGIFFNVNNIASLSSLDAIDVRTGNTLAINHSQDVPLDVPFLLAGSGASARGAIRFDRDRILTGAITLTANAAVSTNTVNNPTGTLAGNIGETGGSRSLTLNSLSGTTGTIVLSGNNTFTGGVVLARGTLRLGSTGALNSASPNLITFANSTDAKFVTLNGFSVVAGGLSSLGTTDVITVRNAHANPATLTIQTAGTHTFRGTLTDGTGGGALSLAKVGTGTQILTRASTYTGSTRIGEGTLHLDFSASGAPASNLVGSSSALVMGGGTLSLMGGNASANSQTVNGTTVAAGDSTVSLTTSATPQDLVLNLGALTAQEGGRINFILPAGAPSATNGIRTATANDATGILGGWATVNGNDWATVSGGNIIAYTDYELITHFGSGDGAIGPLPNDPVANVKIIDGGASGNIAMGNPGSTTDINTLMQSAAGDAVIGSGAGDALRLGVSGGIALAAGAGDLTLGTAANNGGTLTAGGSATGTAGNLIFIDQAADQITTVHANIKDNGAGGTVSVAKNGPGTLILTGAGSDYSGGTFLNGGILRVSADGGLGAVPGGADSNNLTFSGGTLRWGAAFNLNANRGITLNKSGTLDLQGFNSSYSGMITGAGSLTKSGTTASTLTLNGANDYAGDTYVNGGTLVAENNLALGSAVGGTQVASAAVLRLGVGITVTGETLTINGPGNNQGNLQVQGGAAEWAGDVIIANDAARIGTNGSGTLTVSGVIRNGTGSKLGISAMGGTVVLTANNTYTGWTEMIRGVLRLGTDNALSSSTVLSLLTNTVVTETVAVDLYGHDQVVAGLRHGVVSNVDNLSITNSQAGDASTLIIGQTGNYTYSGKITGNLDLIKEGSGTLTLTNTFNQASPTASVNSFTGKTTIRGGTLALSGTGNLTGTPWIQVDQGAAFNISGRTGGDYTLVNQVLSGRGRVDGQLNVSGSSQLSPGDSTGALADAGDGIGELTFNNLTLTGGTPTQRGLLQLGGTTSNLNDSLAGGDPAYFANAESGSLYDTLQVGGSLGLNAGSILKVELLDTYTPALGDVFNLLDWNVLNLDADGAGGAEAWTLADLDLGDANAALGNGWYFETGQFLQHGIIYVTVPEPSRVLLLVIGFTTLLMRRRR